jgi:hypothetical protein
MRLQNDTRIGQERPETPETPETPGTPGTPQSQDSSIPWVADQVFQKDGSRFLEDIVAEEIMYPLCRILWQFLLSPLWEWTLRPTLWECLLRPILWERIIRQWFWEGFSRQILWEGMMRRMLFEGLIQNFLGERVFNLLHQLWEDELIPLLEIIVEAKVLPLYRKLDKVILSPVRRILKLILSPIRVLKCIFGLLRQIIFEPLLGPILRRIPPEETLAFLFVVWISARITRSSSDAYFFARGVSP